MAMRSTFVERNLVLPPVVELRGSRALVVGDVLRGFKRTLVLQIRSDAAVRYNLE